jgi:hypothetical protein
MASAVINPRGFHTHGKEFFAAAEAVYASSKPKTLPLAFLWGRTIELLLKSYLLSVGVSIERLRSREFGHNLVALYTEARARGIDPLVGADSVLAGLMQLLNLEYGSKRLEYRESGTMYSIPDAEITRAVIRRLLKGINFHLRQNGI